MKDVYKRFGIKLDESVASEQFVNKVNNIIVYSNLFDLTDHIHPDDANDLIETISWNLVDKLGLDWGISNSINSCFRSGNYKITLLRLQALLDVLWEETRARTIHDSLVVRLKYAISNLPLVLGIRIVERKGGPAQILLSGSKLMDEKLVDDVLGMLEGEEKKSIRVAFEKCLREFLSAGTKLEKLKDVIRDAQQAGDELIKFVFEDKSLGLRHLFKNDRWKTLDLDSYQKQVFEAVNDYCDKRAKHKSDHEFRKEDAEFVIYQIGILIRTCIGKKEK